MFTGKITVINLVVTSKGKFPKEVENRYVKGTVKGILESQGTSKRTEKDCSEPEYQELDAWDTIVDGKKLREILLTLPFTFQFNRNLKPEDWKDMDQVLKLNQLLKDLFQWSMDKKSFKLASQWEELGEIFQKICLKDIPFKDLMVIARGWNSKRHFKLLEERETSIREIQVTIQAIEEQLNQKEPTLIPSCSQGVDQPNPPVASHHLGTTRSVAKSHYYLQFQVVSRRRKGYKGKNNTSFSQRQREPDPMNHNLVGIGERSTQDPEIVVSTLRISSPINRNIYPTQNEYNVVTPESNSKIDQLWLQISQF
ncbi:hypothetical protein O181_025505 [Austropuccinia psidii MF-1]|uniref:Uncharacterized protein n=1 Tax=Austropuccinia psidii MF-1 TaxID=1389203 RepID=A0A9Q3CMS1_9BASI|nr:hypothetical protein [Austropuccinia psidii MF-1]